MAYRVSCVRSIRSSLHVVWSVERVLLVVWDSVLHLSSDEDLGESKTHRVSKLVVVLVIPLSHGVHEFVMYVLSVDNEVVLDVEDEVPWVGECLGHGAELVEVSSSSGLALLQVVSNIVNNRSQILNRVKDRVESGVLELINNTTKSLPGVLGVTEALDTVWYLSLNRTSKETLEDLAHSEEGEVHVGASHGLVAVEFLVLLNIDLSKEVLPVVIEIEEEFFVVDHLCLSIEEHGSSLTEVLSCVQEVTHSVVMETLTNILEDVNTIYNDALSCLQEKLLWMQESLSHSLDLFVVMVINLTAMVKHITNIRYRESELVNSFGDLLVASVPESSH